MRRLLKIREFFDLKKRALEENSSGHSDSNRPAKRPRTGSKSGGGPVVALEAALSDKGHERFFKVFESEGAKDCVWWLPGRRGEAFAMHKERFEHNLLKIQLEERSFSEFLGKLKRWGFRQMNIPSLSGRILAFENSSLAGIRGCSSGTAHEHNESSRESNRRRNHHLHQDQTSGSTAVSTQSQEAHNQQQAESLASIASLSSGQLQQAHHMVQQEIAQTYFSLLWQELQRQLSILLIHQSQANSPQLAAAPRSEILDLASLLHQQQVQQQVMAAQFIRAAVAQPSSLIEQQTVVREINELQQQQLSNLTYQIVALVAANLEQQNHNPQVPEAPTIHRILVKYMIALVLLQLQQQQHNLEFLRQERLAALALVRSVHNSPEVALPEPLNTLQMQQLLSEAATLSLSRAHQLLCEAAILIPDTVHQPTAQTPGTPPPPPPPPPFPGSGLGPHPPRTTAAR